MKPTQTTSSMNKITKFFKKTKLKRIIKSLNSDEIEYVVGVLLVRSLYIFNDTRYKTLLGFIEKFDANNLGSDKTDKVLNEFDYDSILEVLNETPVRSEKLSKLMRQCSARKIKNPVILALIIEE